MKIGITLNLSNNFWANGLNQNGVFLYEIIEKIGYQPFYITQQLPSYNLNFNHKAFLLKDLILDNQEYLDVILMVGYELPLDFVRKLKSRNNKTKFIFVELGNSLLNQMGTLVNPPNQDDAIFNDFKFNEYIDAVWTSPHYECNKPYLSTLFNTNNVHTCNYLWSPFFLQKKAQDLNSKGLNPFFQSMSHNINVFEPNLNISKCSLIPFMAVQKFNYLFPEKPLSLNIFNSSKIRKSKFLQSWFNKFPVTQNNKCFFNNRWSTLDALSKFGGVILSHNHKNALNYSHFEALYMGTPLIHNSESLMGHGYYYPEFDVTMAAMQLNSAFQNHESTFMKDRSLAREFLAQFDPSNKSNINAYKKLIDEA